MTDKTFVMELTDAFGAVIFRASLDAGAITGNPAVGAFRYSNKPAQASGGFSQIKVTKNRGAYRVTARAYGDLSAASENMVTHFFVADQEWTVVAKWERLKNRWRFTGR